MITGRITSTISTMRRPTLALADLSKAIETPTLAPGRDAPGTPTPVPERETSDARRSGFITLRLEPGLDSPETDDFNAIVGMAERFDLRSLAEIIDRFDLGAGRRLANALPPSRIREMEERARGSAFPPLRSLLSYWRLDARQHGERIEEIVKILRAAPGVADAYVDLEGDDPAVNPANDVYAGQQGYLDAAPVGIDARWAWNQPNGCGNGIGVVDVERGWRLGHDDYAAKSPTLLYGDNRPLSADHGTAVFGEMIADDNAIGVVGIANAAALVRASSYWDQATNTSSDYANAFLAAIDALSPGDCMILEIQVGGAPVERVDEAFDATRLASALGIIVFEAAGNGAVNLDTLSTTSGQILNPASPDFRDSGAIICGAAESALPHERASFSSFGVRVDCYGWGENVVTTGYGDLDGGGDVNAEYTAEFGGTSSATPIVTGAGMVVQAMHEQATGARLSPAQMRLILSNPATGTPQGPTVAGNIGVMPNLRAILDNDLGAAADVYLRDNAGDDGTVPTMGGISASPDVIVRPIPAANPQGAFGEGSGTENSQTLGFPVEAGQDNYIYVRMRNRGGTDANGVKARVFWSPVSTLVTPSIWTLIGDTPAVDAPVGDTLVVSDALIWPSGDIPGEGHYCFVAILDHPADPAPVLPSPTDFDGFRAFIRGQNNVTWRNFNVVDELDDPAADPSVQEFLIANFPDARRHFDFVIKRRMPREARVWLELPDQIAKPFCGELNVQCERDRERRLTRVLLPSACNLTARRVLLPAEAQLACRFIIEGLSKHGRPGHEISIGQHFEGEELGRVTWRFDRKRDPERNC